MSIPMRQIDDFFSGYARALGARDIPAIASHWGVPTLVLSDLGAIVATRMEEVEAFFASSMEQYAKVATAHANIRSVSALSDTVASCQVAWEHRDGAGNVVGGEQGHYLLKHDGTALHIHSYTPGSLT